MPTIKKKHYDNRNCLSLPPTADKRLYKQTSEVTCVLSRLAEPKVEDIMQS
jgi:hypothetical protein